MKIIYAQDRLRVTKFATVLVISTTLSGCMSSDWAEISSETTGSIRTSTTYRPAPAANKNAIAPLKAYAPIVATNKVVNLGAAPGKLSNSNGVQMANLANIAADPLGAEPPTSQPVYVPTPPRSPKLPSAAELGNTIKHDACEKYPKQPVPKATAARITPGHPYYIEIRMRDTPMFPSGHTYVTYGDLNQNGHPVTTYYTGLGPQGSFVGGGASFALPVPGKTTPHANDCMLTPGAVYRVSLNHQQFEKVMTKIVRTKIRPPVYNIWAHNCNHYALGLAELAGLKRPRNPNVAARLFTGALIKANEG